MDFYKKGLCNMANSWFKCEKCGYEEQRLLPPHIIKSDTPCPKCKGLMVRKPEKK